MPVSLHPANSIFFPGGGGGGGSVTKLYPTQAAPRTVACKAPLSMGFSRQEYWSGLPIPSPGDLPDLGVKPGSPALQADLFIDWAMREAKMESKGNTSSKCRHTYWPNSRVTIVFLQKANRGVCSIGLPQAIWQWGIHYWPSLNILLKPRRLSESSE